MCIRDRYKDRVHNGTFAEVLQTCAIEPGDVFYVPAGRVHGIGAGAFPVHPPDNIAKIRSIHVKDGHKL